MDDVIIEIVIGLVGGVIGGLLGVGGGIVFVPAMVVILGTDQIIAQGVSLTVVVATALVAVGQHRRNRTIDYAVARWMVLPAIGLGLVGAFVAGELGSDVLSRAFGVVAILVALRMALTTWRSRRAVVEAPLPRR